MSDEFIDIEGALISLAEAKAELDSAHESVLKVIDELQEELEGAREENFSEEYAELEEETEAAIERLLGVAEPGTAAEGLNLIEVVDLVVDQVTKLQEARAELRAEVKVWRRLAGNGDDEKDRAADRTQRLQRLLRQDQVAPVEQATLEADVEVNAALPTPGQESLFALNGDAAASATEEDA